MGAKKTLSQWRRMLRLMGWFYIPLLGFVRPKLELINDDEAVVSIRLRRRTRNHLKSMYFGALAVGADVAAGLHAFYFSDELGVKPAFVFRSMKGTFHKRAMGTVWFTSSDGQKVKETVLLAQTSGERQHALVTVEARTADGESVATFEMEISIKLK
jgi:acyl-coenzyme A thioesterase PaaI-like protein